MRIKLFFIFITMFLFGIFSHAKTVTPVGYWLLKDEDGRAKTIIRIYSDKNTLCAILIEYSPNKTARCTACSGILTNRPFRGLQFITNLSNNGDNQWGDGKILNPVNGEYSKVSINLESSGDALTINTHNFLSWFSDNDIWIRHNIE